MVLSSLNPGKEVILIDIEGGQGVKAKLYSMGLVPGANLKILSRNGTGPIMIAIKDSKLAVGLGMAQKIIVE